MESTVEKDPLLDETEVQVENQRNAKFLQRYYRQPMAPGKDKNGKDIDGVWIKLPGHKDPIYVNQEAHIKRLLLENGGQVANDPRPGAKYVQPRHIDDVPGPAATPSEHIQKIDALEKEVGGLKDGMAQILALLQGQFGNPHDEQGNKGKK